MKGINGLELTLFEIGVCNLILQLTFFAVLGIRYKRKYQIIMGCKWLKTV